MEKSQYSVTYLIDWEGELVTVTAAFSHDLTPAEHHTKKVKGEINASKKRMVKEIKEALSLHFGVSLDSVEVVS